MQINKVELRNLELEDYIELKNSMLQAYEEGVFTKIDFSVKLVQIYSYMTHTL